MNSFDLENLSGMTILMVDDVPENLDILGHIFKVLGLNLSVVTNGEKALKIAEINPPDLILLDIMMPGMDGFEVCERLKKGINTKDIPIIFITAKVETDDILKGFSVGCVDYITKPFQEREVVARVNTHLQLKKLLLEKKRLINDLKNLNDELVESNNRYDVMVATITNMIIRLDSEKKIKFITPDFVRSLGYQPSDMLEKPIENFLLAEEKEKILQQLATRRFKRPTRKLKVKFVINKEGTIGDSIQTLTLELDTFGIWNLPNDILAKEEKEGLEKTFIETLCMGNLISQLN